MTFGAKIYEHLTFIYGDGPTENVYPQLTQRLTDFKAHFPHLPERKRSLSQQDAILITYGDQVSEQNKSPLLTLNLFADKYLKDCLNGIHLLPFYPYSSDDGFSVVNYRQVDPRLGDWDDINRLGCDFRLMFDAVINHISVESDWFQPFLRDEKPYTDYFITVDPGTDLSMVVRPRALPLLTTFETPSGQKNVWTTFSEDQVDLNYSNPQVLLEIVEVLLFYIAQGAEFIRLDAIAYLWKEVGTPSIHLPQTHRVIQLFRTILDVVAPHVMLITETNVPHSENISYFGDGSNEAQLVYNFALPPLTLYTLSRGDAQVLSDWVEDLRLPSESTTFFNFLASHDGIGLNPARGILPEEEIERMVHLVQSHGGLVSYKTNADGSQSAYELNINYFDALSDPASEEPLGEQIDRFVVAHAIMFSLIGVPGIYFHSLFGSRGWLQGVALTGRNRTINRQRLTWGVLTGEMSDPNSLRYRVYWQLAALLRIRSRQPAFHPHGSQQVLRLSPQVFALLRISPDQVQRILCLHNVSDHPQSISLDLDVLKASGLVNLIEQQELSGTNFRFELAPYQVSWFELECRS